MQKLSASNRHAQGIAMSEGFVYLLTNEAMPGYVKIGPTQGNDVAARMNKILEL